MADEEEKDLMIATLNKRVASLESELGSLQSLSLIHIFPGFAAGPR